MKRDVTARVRASRYASANNGQLPRRTVINPAPQIIVHFAASRTQWEVHMSIRRLLFLRQQRTTLHNMHVQGETSHNCHDLSGELCQRALLSFLELVENGRRHDLARPTSSKELNVTTPQSVKLRETHFSRLLLCLKPFF